MGQNWVGTETARCDLGDVRLNRRLEAMLAALGDRPGKSLPTAFQDWSNTKAAYRFFSNENVSEDKILEGHFAATGLRFEATNGPILILQDTTEFTFKRSAPEKVGFTKISTGRKMKEGRFQKHAVCGLLMHASMAITPDGLPLGLTAAKFWSRSKFKGTAALKRKINPTRVPIEEKESMRWLDNLRLSTELTGAPERCVHIGDRESDIYELYCLAEELGTGFLVRSCVDRLAENGGTTIAKVMAEVQSSGTHEIRFRDAQGKDHCAVLSVKHATMTVRPPIGKQKKYRHQDLQIIHAEELNPPEGRVPVFWKLITNLPVTTHADAVHKLDWYALRWKIETFFRTLKTGCRIEELRLATADRLANCIALCCVVAWRVSWLTMLSREAPKASSDAVFTNTERSLLERATPDRKRNVLRDLNFYIRAVARLGGYLDRTSDAPPGTTVIWRGLSRLADLAEGVRIAEAQPQETYG
ncbi:IS4 family transposase [Sulfitobacter sp. Ks41]|uniref:IS4 family transposase n=1 Tax=Sulfitobacter faviae TaxID=1775881 RepID=A0AAX3LR08_9RHOB|nr:MULTISPECIES: IS4 family transposase [Sulfitobacter]MDF3362731.1 IS4 family transposase [Sulfitobacter sp. Ks41]WCE71010.1 IS4 family transposase [Sulfitobacter faviae]WCE72117.1 IS4 family transposase [Sulfitobacter faviae]